MRLIKGTENIYSNSVIGNVRKAQEDSCGIELMTVNGDLFVVCDGMGGHVGGKMASEIAVKSILDYLKKEKYADPASALDEALQFANMQILGYAEEHPELKGMGTTACILLLQDTYAYIAHAGDSRIYLYVPDKHQLHRITKDHSYVQTLVDAGQITDDEAESHPNKNIITKALGIKKDLAPTIQTNPLQVKKGDVFLICSDGLSGMVSDQNILRILEQDMPLAQKGDDLINAALINGGVDNITMELIEISDSPFSNRIFPSFHTVQTEDKVENSKSGIKKKGFSLPFKLASIIVAFLICMVSGYMIHLGSINKRIENNRDEKTSKIEELKNLTTDLSGLRTQLNDTNENTTESTDTTKTKKTNIINAINVLESDSTDCQNQIKDLQNIITKDSARLKKVDIFKIYQKDIDTTKS